MPVEARSANADQGGTEGPQPRRRLKPADMAMDAVIVIEEAISDIDRRGRRVDLTYGRVRLRKRTTGTQHDPQRKAPESSSRQAADGIEHGLFLQPDGRWLGLGYAATPSG